MDIISNFLDIGGTELLMMTDDSGNTTLHYTCKKSNISMDIISKLIDVRGRELFVKKNKDGYTVLYYGCISFPC